MAQRLVSLVLVAVLGAGAAHAATPTPLEAFARLLESAGDSLIRSTAPRTPPRTVAQPIARPPLPNLRPDEATVSHEVTAPGVIEAAADPATAPASVPPASAAPVVAEAKAPTPAITETKDPATPPLSFAPPPAAVPGTPAAGPSPFALASVAPRIEPTGSALPVPLVSTNTDTPTPIPTYHPRPALPAAAPFESAGPPTVIAAIPAPAVASPTTTPAAKPVVAPTPAAKPTPVALPTVGGGSKPAAPSESTTSCAVALAAFGVKATPATALVEGECRVSAPVLVSSAGGLELMPKALIDCATAATLAAWLQDTIEPKVQTYLGTGAKLTAIRVLDAYNCRTVDNIPGANVSLHARGKAIDIGAFRIGNRWLNVGSKDLHEDEQAFLDAVRASACGPFTTVLGPGTDAYHYNHFHLDLSERQTAGPSKGLYCH